MVSRSITSASWSTSKPCNRRCGVSAIVITISTQKKCANKPPNEVINATGEKQAAQTLLEAAEILQPVPQAMQLRYLATLFEIASERSSTIVFPFPIDLLQAWSTKMGATPAEAP
jgi:hypothetical protein